MNTQNLTGASRTTEILNAMRVRQAASKPSKAKGNLKAAPRSGILQAGELLLDAQYGKTGLSASLTPAEALIATIDAEIGVGEDYDLGEYNLGEVADWEA